MAGWVPITFSIVSAVFGIVATALMGMAVGKLNDLRAVQEKQGDLLLAHITSSHVHEAGLVRLEEQIRNVQEQIKNVLKIAQVAHERADRLETTVASLRGHG